MVVTSEAGEQLIFTQDIKYQPLTLSAQGLEVDYSYDGNWRLLGVQKNRAGSITNRSFLYENQMYPRFLTGIIDENGERYATWTYDASGQFPVVMRMELITQELRITLMVPPALLIP